MTAVMVAGAVAFVLAVALAQLCKPIAKRTGLVARPKADRWHREVIPLLGGCAIAGAVALALVIAPVADRQLLTLVAGALALAVVGLLDDIRPFRPQTKFVLQILAASAMVTLGFQLHLSGYPGLDVLLTLLWIVGITNAFNLLDNMDGLAAGIAAIAAAFRLTFFLNDGDLQAAQVAAAVVGACLGFLVHNFNPASIFMGDAGSLFLGFLVAGLSLVGSWPYSRSTVSVLAFPVLLLLVPIFDTTFVTVVRTWAGRPISQGGRDHTSHRLVASGLSERGAVLLLYGVAALCGGVAFYAYAGALSTSIVLIAFLAIGLVLLGVYLGRVEVYAAAGTEADADAAPRRAFVRLIDAFPWKRQVVTVFLDSWLIVLAYYCAYRLRFETTYAAEEPFFVTSLPIVLATQLSAFAAFRVYQGVWRYTGVPDAVRLAKAVSAGCAASIIALLLLYRFVGYSRAVFVIDAVLLLVFVGGARLSFRLLDEVFRHAPHDVRRVLIYGAGDGGVLAMREIQGNQGLGRVVIGFLDDDRWKRATQVRGIPVIGGLDQLVEILEKHAIDEVIVASTRIPLHRLRTLADLCGERDVSVVRASLVVSGAVAS
jgi:UDP-GlcNAc:undecaprenyl-phosphate/decaprenyl-phosphate GlcNAc-1-phosphate transferase